MTVKVDRSSCAGAIAKVTNPPRLAFATGADDVLQVETRGDVERQCPITPDKAIISELLGQIAVLGSHGKRVDEGASNFALGFVDSMKPRDAAETLPLTQMAAIHQATMMMARRFNHVENITQQDSTERALNKLGRTFPRYVARWSYQPARPGARGIAGAENAVNPGPDLYTFFKRFHRIILQPMRE